MSGIAGAVADDGSPLDPALPGRLVAAAPVRGFDGTTVWHDGPACLIRHHHATTPQAVGETQPLASRDGRSVVLLDGRIDNRSELIDLLARDDCRDDAPDVALVLALWERFGEECMSRLVGDWALAVWRPHDRSLFLARSPMGWRPLLWGHANRVFAFSTEPRALLKGLGLDHAVNEGVAGEFLSLRFMTRSETLWSALHQVAQGGALRFERGRVRLWHWHVAFAAVDERLSDTDHIDRFNALFNQAVVAASRSNTPVSAQLSGGLDSSSVVARAIELHRVGRIHRPLQAISARFPGEAHDETQWSSAVEEKLGIAARVTTTLPYCFDAAHRWTAATYQLPIRPNFFDTGMAALRLMEAEGSRVLLTGEGGDDWMSTGVAYFADLLRQGRIGAIIGAAAGQRPDEPIVRRLSRAAYWSVAPHLSARHRRRIALPHIATGPVPPWIGADWARGIDLAGRFGAAAPSITLSSHVQQQRYANFDAPSRFFIFGSTTAMAEQHGVEFRHPFHDLRLTRFFMSAAPRMMQQGTIRKIVLREAMRRTLPETVRTRRGKAEFSAGIAEVVAARLRARPIDTMLPVALGWVDGRAARTMADAISRPGEHLDVAALARVWNIVALDVWLAEAASA